jgi:hypothetical protein
MKGAGGPTLLVTADFLKKEFRIGNTCKKLPLYLEYFRDIFISVLLE